MSPIQRLREQLRGLLHLDESPERTALAFAVGVFIAFSPTYGFHILSALFCAWAFRLNVPALMAGTFINNPWTFVPIIGATFWTGFVVMGQPAAPALDWHALTPEALYEQIAPYVVPFVVGGVALSVLGACLGYLILLTVIRRVRERRRAESRVAAPPGVG